MDAAALPASSQSPASWLERAEITDGAVLSSSWMETALFRAYTSHYLCIAFILGMWLHWWMIASGCTAFSSCGIWHGEPYIWLVMQEQRKQISHDCRNKTPLLTTQHSCEIKYNFSSAPTFACKSKCFLI